MLQHKTLSDAVLHGLIRRRKICFAGNRRLKIYGTLHCGSGKRMHKENRVFFADENAAKQAGFRPCGHCLKQAYQQWKRNEQF